MGTRRVSLSFL